jgi:prephenate dehydratase
VGNLVIAGPVAYLGPEGTFTHIAAKRAAMHADAPVIAKPSVSDVVESVVTGEARSGVIAIENSVEGVVNASLDQLVFRPNDLTIIEELAVEVSFDAYRSAEAESEARIIGSHPHALAQCKRYIQELGLPVESFLSTAAAVRAAENRYELIALGAPGLSEDYSVRVIKQGVQDYRAVTRFVHFQLATAPRREINAECYDGTSRLWKTTLVITPPMSAAGVLTHVFSCFSDRGINVLSVSSRPLADHPGAYAFVVTLASGGDSPSLGYAALDLLQTGNHLKHLGSYPSDATPKEPSMRKPFDAPSGSLSASTPYDRIASAFPGLMPEGE